MRRGTLCRFFCVRRDSRLSFSAQRPQNATCSSYAVLWNRACSVSCVPRAAAANASPRSTRLSLRRGIPMSVSGIFSSSFSNNQVSSAYQLTQSQFQQLGQDLASGNLSAAQSDFAILEQAFTQPTATLTTSNSNPVAQGLQQLATDLKSRQLVRCQAGLLHHSTGPPEFVLGAAFAQSSPRPDWKQPGTADSWQCESAHAGSVVEHISDLGRCCARRYANPEQQLQPVILGDGTTTDSALSNSTSVSLLA